MGQALFWVHVGGVAVATVIASAVAYWIRGTFDRPDSTWMSYLLIVLSVWGVLYVFQLLATPLNHKVVFFLLGKPLGKATFLLWFVFVLVFTGREYWLTPAVKRLLAGSFALVAVLTVTNPLHGLLWSDFRMTEAGFTHLHPVSMPLETAIMMGMGIIAFVGVGLLIKSLFASQQVTKKPILVLTVGFLLAIPSAFLEMIDSLPVPGFEYGLISTVVFITAVGIAVFRYDLFVIGPIARSAVFDALEDGIVVLDADHRIVDYNRSAAEIVPEIEDSLGDPHLSVFPEDVFDDEADGGEQIGDGPSSTLKNTIERTVDGERRRYAVTLSPLSLRGDTRGYCIVLRNQTEVEQYANQLERQAERLDDFASTVSHDLRNPLMVAHGQLTLARETGDPETFDNIEEALDRMDEIIDDALSLARAGEFSVEKEMVPLEDIASAAWDQIHSDAATLDTSGVTSGSLLYADVQQFQTVFENLFRNSIDHSDGEVRIRVATDEDGFIVEDDGPGIPREHRDEIFDRGFTTGDETTGLGLSIVRQIVEGHGWEIRAGPSASGGARFEIRT